MALGTGNTFRQDRGPVSEADTLAEILCCTKRPP